MSQSSMIKYHAQGSSQENNFPQHLHQYNYNCSSQLRPFSSYFFWLSRSQIPKTTHPKPCPNHLDVFGFWWTRRFWCLQSLRSTVASENGEGWRSSLPFWGFSGVGLCKIIVSSPHSKTTISGVWMWRLTCQKMAMIVWVLNDVDVLKSRWAGTTLDCYFFERTSHLKIQVVLTQKRRFVMTWKKPTRISYSMYVRLFSRFIDWRWKIHILFLQQIGEVYT